MMVAGLVITAGLVALGLVPWVYQKYQCSLFRAMLVFGAALTVVLIALGTHSALQAAAEPPKRGWNSNLARNLGPPGRSLPSPPAIFFFIRIVLQFGYA